MRHLTLEAIRHLALEAIRHLALEAIRHLTLEAIRHLTLEAIRHLAFQDSLRHGITNYVTASSNTKITSLCQKLRHDVKVKLKNVS